MATTNQSTLIIGAGVFGTSTAYHLSQQSRGQITVIDRTPYPPAPAASTDINKIVRADYSSAFYMALAYEALDAWSTSPLLSTFYHRTGWINLQPRDSDLGERIRANFRRGVGGRKDPTSDVSLDECREKWGGCLREADFGGLKKAYWNPEAGWADAGAAVKAMMDEAVGNGVRYVCGDVERLLLSQNGKGVSGVKLKSGDTYTADTVLLCTGAWTSALMTTLEDSLGIPEDQRVEKQATAAGVSVVHFRLSDEEMEQLKDMPVIIYGERGEVMPPPRIEGAGTPNGKNLLKYTNAGSFSHYVKTASGRRISVPPDGDQTVVPERLQEETLREMVRKSLPQYANRPIEYYRLCWDAVTPTQDQLITKHPHPGVGNLFLAVGGSFHSWKFLPTIGKYVVNVLEGKSNGKEKDAAWAWKSDTTMTKGAHEKVIPKRDLRDLESGRGIRGESRL